MTVSLSQNEQIDIKSFTGRKPDILQNAAADIAVLAYDFRVLFCIAQHVNARTGTAKVSDDTVADETVGSRRNVIRSRRRLKRAGWLDWIGSRGVNEYRLTSVRENEIMDTRILNREARQEKRTLGLNNRRTVPPVSQQKADTVTPVSQQEVTPVALRDVTPVSPKHLTSNTVPSTPYRRWADDEVVIGRAAIRTEGSMSFDRAPRVEAA